MTRPVSTRGRAMPPSPIRNLMPFAEEAKSRGVRVLHLNIGQPDLETPAPMREALSKIDRRTLAYTPSQGTDEYLDSILSDYRRIGIELARDEILATAGGSEALIFAMMACADPGDEVLLVEPFYANYRSFATMAGLHVKALTARGRDGFHLPPLHLWEASVTPRTRFVLLCNPNNPTGVVYTADEMQMVADFCTRHDLFLISDEVYRDFVYDGVEAISALTLEDLEDRVITVDSLSKRFSACGIRLGWLATRNRGLYSAMMRMAQGRLSAPGLAQLIAPAVATLGDEYFRKVRSEYQRRRDLLYDGLTSIDGVFLERPEGAFYFVVRLPIDDSQDFARWLLTDFEHHGSTVMVAPATGFYASNHLGRNEVRVAYVLNTEDLTLAIEILARAIPRYQEIRGEELAAAGMVP
ncbi:MAG: pyridoxal phosphate-dependent aminotransferase [Thermoanaerobaculia bacterium]